MIDPASGTWAAVTNHCRAYIESARLRLETPGLDHAETERERGKIAAYREILGLTEPRRLDEMAASAPYDP